MFEDVLTGAIMMGFAIAGLMFLRYWRDTGERLFGFFALSFFVLAANRALLVFYLNNEDDLIPYVVRLLAFLILLAAILDKNLRRT